MNTKSHRSVSFYKVGPKGPRVLSFFLVSVLMLLMLASCDVTPVKPEEVFILYRERMNSNNTRDARKLLSAESSTLVGLIDQQYKMDQPPEKIALINILDPVAAPTLIKMDHGVSLLQVRTLRGGNHLIRLAKSDSNSPWKIDIAEELKSLQTFLEAKDALSGLQQQAGEFAASWKAFDKQLEQLGGPEPESKPQIKEAIRKPSKAKLSSKKTPSHVTSHKAK